MNDIPIPPPDVVKRIDGVLKIARAQLVQKGGLAPVFFIMHDDEVEVVTTEFETPGDKDRTAMMVRGLVDAHDAHTVVTLMEIWTLPPTMPYEQVRELRARYSQVADMPGRIEAVRVAIEQRDGQTWDAVAPIQRQGRAVKLATPYYRDLSAINAEASGRFAGWFAPERQSPPPAPPTGKK